MSPPQANVTPCLLEMKTPFAAKVKHFKSDDSQRDSLAQHLLEILEKYRLWYLPDHTRQILLRTYNTTLRTEHIIHLSLRPDKCPNPAFEEVNPRTWIGRYTENLVELMEHLTSVKRDGPEGFSYYSLHKDLIELLEPIIGDCSGEKWAMLHYTGGPKRQ